MLHNYVTCLAS